MSEPESAPEQPLLAHLMELRTCVVRAMFGFIIVLLPLLFFAGKLYHFLATPMMKLLPAGSSMIATEVAAPFLTPFKLAAVVAFALALPWILYQIWLFVAPGLYRNERRLIMPMLASSTLLFYAGVAFAYYLVLPTVFKFFVTSAPEGVAVMTDVSKYLDFVLKLFLAFGFVFEMPVAIVLMVLTGFVTPAQLAARRDYVLVGVFIAAAVLTPPDVLSQIMLAVPAYLLYELGILVARWVAPVPEPAESTEI
ncbi:twin-arginine translocase subunit TatC [Nevskia ramosa]|uniref:twin-arginine translocase subunit TatC n=1 Tax=Nevskia ramosa TaxID=64002 RepID=UPI0003B6F85F|nr:twin-arginine translocase subunit TatC [Nevskia ramosa]